MKSLIAALAVASVAFTGCGGGDNEGATSGTATSGPASSTATAAPTPSPTPTPTPSKPPQVSEKTTCDLLFTQSGKSPLAVIADFVNRASSTEAQADKTQDAIDELNEIAASASDHLAPQIISYASVAQTILDQARSPAGSNVDSTPLKSAGLELTNTCLPYY